MNTKGQKQSEFFDINVDRVKTITPMMHQYITIKNENPEGLLFYRMGDFYELFFDDAIVAATALNITLTKRGKHLGKDIAMCGVPAHSHESYLSRLIKQGHKVVICEQTESPAEAKKRGSKSVVRREVVRTITPGTLLEDTLLDRKQNNFLASLSGIKSTYAMAWLDVSTGDFQMQALFEDSIGAALARVNPGELLISEDLLRSINSSEILEPWKECLSILPRSSFDSVNGYKRLQNLYKVSTLDAYGTFSGAELSAGGALIGYVELTQQGQLPRIASPRQIIEGSVLEIDAATRRNLELTQTLDGERNGSLLSMVDQTLTGSGGRLFSKQLSAPLTDVAAITRRLDAVNFFYDNHKTLDVLRGFLMEVPDIERALSRISLARSGPRDLAVIRDGLSLSAKIRSCLEQHTLPDGLYTVLMNVGEHLDLVMVLTKALKIDLPLHSRDGGFIVDGFSQDFDELRELRDESRQLIAGLQARYIEISGVQGLKIKHNNVLGYFIEVSLRNEEFMPVVPSGVFIRRQTMKNVVRYTTIELSDLEGKIASAADKLIAMELELYDELIGSVLGQAEQIASIASALACIDVSAALATLAIEQGYSRPEIDESLNFDVYGGRHPIVERAVLDENNLGVLSGDPTNFVANDCNLTGASKIWLLTGPNMAGKSTFLRQNALMVVLAQMGSFIPADKAHIGVVDRLFSRVGAGDDLARGRSTFMVEMIETATILSQATERSFVILDEIGRGTATFDGLSIAWAVVEHLYENNRSRALFATHYHELTRLSSRLDGLTCHMMRVKEWHENIIFLHEVIPGAADQSYGIHVGQLAGLPESVVSRANQVLASLKGSNPPGDISLPTINQLKFDAKLESDHQTNVVKSPVEIELDKILPDELSPKAALELIYKLKSIIK